VMSSEWLDRDFGDEGDDHVFFVAIWQQTTPAFDASDTVCP
jgi:hypothetical protein